MHGKTTTIAVACGLALALGAAASAGLADRSDDTADVADLLARAAHDEAAGYTATRDALVARGAEVLPALHAIAGNSGSWREAAAASACAGWIEFGEAYEAFASVSPRATASGMLRYGRPDMPREATVDLAPLLVERLVWTESDESLRTAAVDLLQRERDPRATRPLAWALLADPSPTVRRATVDALERATDPTATAALLDALAELDDDSLREAVAGALGGRKDVAAVPALRALLGESQHDATRARAAQSLGWIGDAAALPELTNALDGDPAAEVRQHAALALGRLGDDDARAALGRAIAGDPDAEVVRLANHALERQ